MEINQHNLGILRQAVETRFKNAFRALEKNLYGEFTMTIPMGTSQIDMPMLEQLVGMREWLDDRKVNNLTTQMLTVKPRKFENTYGIPADAIADDQYGVYVGMFEQMAAQAVNLRPDLIEQLLIGASSAKWLDGENFFGTSRKYGKNTINNYTTNALTQANFKTAYAAMTSYMGHGNTPLRVRPRYLVHGPAKRWDAISIVDNPMVAKDGAALPNETYGLCQRVEVNNANMGNKWFIFGEALAYKPIGYFERERPDRIVRLDRPQDENVFMRDEYLFGCKGRAEAAFLLPHLAYFGNNS